MDYRDPLFSVIAFFVLILIAILLTILFGKIREILRNREIDNLLREFDFVEIENIPLTDYSINSLLMLAKAYELNGDFEKALKIYLLIEKRQNSIEVLKNVARLYFKAGFLEKAKKVIYKILRVRPRDKEALKQLILIDEKLGNFKEIVDVLEIFEVLGIDLPKERANALIKLYLHNGCNLEEFCKGIESFDDIYKKYPFVRREFVTYLFSVNPKKAYEILDVYKDLDLYFNRGDIPDNEKFCNILAAKKLKKCEKKAIFEIEAMKYLPNNLADLEFEYLCSSCKKIFPIYSTRCPACNELFSLGVIVKLVRKENVGEIEF